MTSRRVMAGVKAYLEGATFTLAGITFATVEENGDKAFPFVLIEDTGTQEHETLIGVYEIGIDVSLHTDPERTTTAAHDTAMDELYAELGNTTSLQASLDGLTSLRCWDVRGVNQATGPEDGRRKTTVAIRVTAAEV